MALSVFAGEANAFDFAYGVNPNVTALTVGGGGAAAGGTYSISVLGGTIAAPDGTLVNALATTNPITIGTGANVETVTPSSVTYTNDATLGPIAIVTATFTNGHARGETVRSGSFGAQEAGTFLAAIGGLVGLSARWFAQFTNHAAGITALTGWKSQNTSTSYLDYSGTPGVFSYNAASGSNLASTTHVIY